MPAAGGGRHRRVSCGRTPVASGVVFVVYPLLKETWKLRAIELRALGSVGYMGGALLRPLMRSLTAAHRQA